MSTLTPRKQHAQRLAIIAKVTGEYDRRFKFTESMSFIDAYTYYRNQGYPITVAAQYAYDHHYAGKRAK